MHKILYWYCVLHNVHVTFLLFFLSLSIGVYDLGGGTFDISILEMQKGVFEVQVSHDSHMVSLTNRLNQLMVTHSLEVKTLTTS